MMGSKTSNWYMIIFLSLYLSSSYVVQCNKIYDRNSLDTLFRDHANQALLKNRTGFFSKVDLPSNFSAMDVSVVRLRSGSFWTRGVNYSAFSIPPRILPSPFVKRVAIVYQDLGNLSSDYYNVQGYKLMSNVLGFFAYDASNLSAIGTKKLNLQVMGGAISIRFPQILEGQTQNEDLKCVRFGDNGVVEMSNMSENHLCLTRDQGHFSVVAPSFEKGQKKSFWKWWVVGFGGGFVVLVVFGLVGILVFKCVRRKKIEDMEKESERGVALDTIWIGRSRMPSVSMLRTQPSFEN